MKTNLISFTAVLALAGILFSGSANAQTYTNTGDVTFKLILNPIQSIVVKTIASQIEYSTIEDYKDGVSEEYEKQLEVFSTQGYEVTAKAANFDGGVNSPAISTINVKAETSDNGTSTVVSGVNLSNTPAKIFSSETATKNTGLSLDIHYTGAKEYAYAQKEFFTQTSGTPEKTTYSTTVTYSIVAL